jgi:penicillin V acylase-like amidase (Ntn superfamily)
MLITSLLLLNYKSYETCTIFTIEKGNKVYFGNNEDWRNNDVLIGYFPSSNDGFGSVHFGYRNDKGTTQFEGAVNEKGLSWDGNSLPRTELKPHPEKAFSHARDNYFYTITKKASTVEEAIQIANEFDFGNSINYQIHIADASGDAVIISSGPDGEIAFTRKTPGDGHLVSTNFNHAIEGNGKRGWRYDTAISMLDEFENNDISIDSVGAVLNAVHLKTLNSFTVYSNLIDLKEKKIYLYYMSQYQEMIAIDIAEELAKGTRVVDMREMFSEETVLAGDKEYRWFEIRSTLPIISIFIIALTSITILVFNIIKKIKKKSLK